MKRACALLCTSLLALTACSGGSDNPAPASPPGSPPVSPLPASGTALVIDETNAKAAVRVAYGATADSMSSGDQVGGGGIASTTDGGLQKPGGKHAVEGAVTKFSQKDPLGPETTDCGIDPSFGKQRLGPRSVRFVAELSELVDWVGNFFLTNGGQYSGSCPRRLLPQPDSVQELNF